MRSREAWILALALVACVGLVGVAHAAPKIELHGGIAGDACAAVRAEGDTKEIRLTVAVDKDGRVVGFETPVRITDATVAAINATLRACKWSASKSERGVPVRVWVPSSWLF